MGNQISTKRRLYIGSKAPNFYLKNVDGNFYSLESFEDKKALLIIFSCNHCPYVQSYEDRIIQIQNDYKDKGLQIAAINSNDDIFYSEDSFENMIKRSREKNFNFPYLRDETQEVARNYSATFTPELFLFNDERELIYTGKIDDNWKEPNRIRNNYLRNALDEYFNGKEISVPETFAFGCTIKWK